MLGPSGGFYPLYRRSLGALALLAREHKDESLLQPFFMRTATPPTSPPSTTRPRARPPPPPSESCASPYYQNSSNVSICSPIAFPPRTLCVCHSLGFCAMQVSAIDDVLSNVRLSIRQASIRDPGGLCSCTCVRVHSIVQYSYYQ